VKHTDYLNKVLAYYVDEGFYFGDGGKWEHAHTPMPRALGNDTVPLLHQHHVIHDLWQSIELDERHFMPFQAKRLLYSSNFWPESWFELCDAFDRYSVSSLEAARKASSVSPKMAEARKNNAKKLGQKFGAANARKGAAKTHAACKKQKIGIWSADVRSKAGKSTSIQLWECLETGKQLPPGPLSRYQNKRGIDTKLRKRIS